MSDDVTPITSPVSEAAYTDLALRTLCPASQIDLTSVSQSRMKDALLNFITAARHLDDIKKITVYGKGRLPVPLSDPFKPAAQVDPQVYHAILGIATEAGELAEAMYAALLSGQALDRTNIKEELGDLEWFEALLRARLMLTAEEVRSANIRKLEARYAKKKFEAEAALKRDHEAERKALN